MATGDIIYGADYNAVQVKVREILGDGQPFGPQGTGDKSFGYNQTPLSSQVAVLTPVIASQWQNLANDINKAYFHQNNSTFTNYATISGEISYANLNNLNNVITPMVITQATRLTAHPNQRTQLQLTALTNTRSIDWGGVGDVGISGSFVLAWPSNFQPDYFFNQGGSFQITGFGPNQSGSVQDSDWLAFLATFNCVFNFSMWNAAGGYPTFNEVYRITDTGSATGNYATNYISVTASKNSNSLFVSVTFRDAHSPGGIGTLGGPGPDTVSGGCGFYVYQTVSSGVIAGYAPSSANTTGAF